MARALVPLDIANGACVHMGVRRLTAFTDDSREAATLSFEYDKKRVAELRRNVWTFATRLAVMRPVDSTVMQIIPAAYNAADTYTVGALVMGTDNQIYFARKNVPINTTPGTPNEAYWTIYFGPTTVTVWSSTTTYFAGELVYTPQSDQYGVYLSLTSANADVPGVLPTWSPTVIYNKGQTVTYLTVTYQSTEDLNFNNTPTGASPWIAVPGTQPNVMYGQNWLKLNATLQSINFVYPLGSGPSTQTATRNVFILPNGFLRRAPQDPKAGANSFLGAPGGRMYDDWEIQDGKLLSQDPTPITLRFVADVQDVSMMDEMFVEGLAARIAFDCVEDLTQSVEKKQAIGGVYNRWMGEARQVNGIEAEPEEPPEDDYVTCRI